MGKWYVLLLLLLLFPVNSWADSIRSLYRESECAMYLGLDRDQLTQAQVLLASALAGESTEHTQVAWQRLGFEWRRLHALGQWWQVIGESAQECRGQGLVLIREDNDGGPMLQMVHRFRDLYTGDIGLRLRATSAKVFFWNTAPRDLVAPDGSSADLAKRWDSLLQPLTRAFAERYPRAAVIQLHGFSNARRNSQAGREAYLILSSGTRWPGSELGDLQLCLQPHIEGPVSRYPDEVRELGGTTNVQGALLRSLAHPGFLHVEMNRALRERILVEDPLCRALAQCLSQYREGS